MENTGLELDDFLKRKIAPKEPDILRLISGGHSLKLKATKGKRLICDAKKTFKSFIDADFSNFGINKPWAPRPEMPIQVHEIVGDAEFLGIFKALPGTWAEKWISQDQIIQFCEKLPKWLRQEGYGTFFLTKKDENQPINEDKPEDNLVVVYVLVLADGLLVRVCSLAIGHLWYGPRRHRLVSPLSPSVV